MFIYPLSSVPRQHYHECRNQYQAFFNHGYTLNVSGSIRAGMQIVFAVHVSNGYKFGNTIRHFLIGEFLVLREFHCGKTATSELHLLTASGQRCKIPISIADSILVLAMPQPHSAQKFHFRDHRSKGYQNVSDKIACRMYDSLA